MTQEHPTKLSFSIEESVWLNKGQEVQEIVGMSLEPDISIEEKDHHVYIKGGLRLIGEYQPAKSEAEVDLEKGSVEDQVSFRSVGDVSLSEDGTGKITHFFPIDVTIPISRIHNLDDVYVQIESFDYDLPEKSCIQLTADISISGMNHPQDQSANRPVATEKKADEKEEYVEPSFSFDAKSATSHKELISPPPLHGGSEEFQPPPSNSWQAPVFNQYYGYQQPLPEETAEEPEQVEQVEEEVDEVEERVEATQEVVDEPSEEVETIEEILEEPRLESEAATEQQEQEDEEEVREATVVVEAVEEEKSVAPLTKMVARPSEPIARPVEEEEVEEVEEVEGDYEPVLEVGKPREENALYLTKMLTKGEERFSKWRMCIIQPNETIDTIAHRYNVSTSQLARMNQLTEEKVEEGQILYIPVSAKS
ncbi:stage VI sporulation protein D [Alkalihalophilus lindianensis]|uniref:Stage VI sporulation protein D n=1 Tax=Alkalihalophilus lindianensis TaxID=1630542 RepID=A0ABU3XAG4_9BACI|nr:stage VI sporulation protein D [Alkalihalophilus lindianensis]MDV2684878.1 stage VI sporulation protein D [Alkalihalophilus lindianensis]